MAREVGRLLIVDDERDFANFLATVAREIGYTVRTVQRSPDFEFQLADWTPSVVFLDIFMPERDGLELLGTLERHSYAGHLVLMSGADALYLNMAASSAKVRGLHLAGVLSKPCRKQQVADLLKTLTASP